MSDTLKTTKHAVQYRSKGAGLLWKPRQKALMREIENEDSPGFCLGCGEFTTGVEPDARRYRCDDCGASLVFGCEELLIAGRYA